MTTRQNSGPSTGSRPRTLNYHRRVRRTRPTGRPVPRRERRWLTRS